MLETQLEIMRKPRITILKTLEEFTLDQLNTIPAGFNNNIIWNLGHMVAAQQGVCYKRAGLDTRVDEAFFNRYKSESKPEGPADEQEYELIKTLFMTSLDQLGEDYKAGIFGNYTTWTTRYGFSMSTIDDALAFLPFHEGLHIGYIMAMRKLV
ncbi:DinB family protein [Mucilaginibacter conchicola]|uniref:DinB family protein n=1 Tax=Mucilaginibacter conchicola TaxID=2303333 RepID=A0A372NN10_9SPHI|nr:DinB family protein [Mucilaginibacter conchicola]RFZ90332.1 DinB family protein [Mucilaginibacter conchicola]